MTSERHTWVPMHCEIPVWFCSGGLARRSCGSIKIIMFQFLKSAQKSSDERWGHQLFRDLGKELDVGLGPIPGVGKALHCPNILSMLLHNWLDGW